MSLRKQWQKYSTLTFELANIHILPDILNSLCCMAVECVMTTDWPNSKIAFQIEIDNLRDRTREAYKYLEKTAYEENANFLVANIKKNLEAIEASQAQEKEIKEHISAYRTNLNLFDQAARDVDALEDLLKAVRAELERSRVKNVLQKVKSIKSVADIAEAIFGTKPSAKTIWKYILSILIFVGLITTVHFSLWAKRSKDAKLREVAKQEEAAAAEKKKT